MESRVEYSVTELNNRIKELLEAGFSRVFVIGEVSNLRRPASGHVYFTLKDEKSQLRAVLFRFWGRMRGDHPPRDQGAALEEGTQILCSGRLGVYQERGEYQLIIDWWEPRGYGALQRAFEKLKAQLQAEGLFDPRVKKPLPFLPRAVGLVTSPTGAVIRDILQIARRRFPTIDIYVAPSRVQGAGAAEEIVQALANIQKIPEVEVIILARGGGTLEDLAPFNEERVARAVYACRVPVISAVGHETDFTIADFVADLRAPTPSAAAELAFPLRNDLRKRLHEYRADLINGMDRFLVRQQERLERTRRELKDPRRIIQERRFALDDRLERIRLLGQTRLNGEKRHLEGLRLRLDTLSPLPVIAQAGNMLALIKSKMIGAVTSFTGMRRTALNALLALLNNINPAAVLARGYSITLTWPEGKVVRDAGQLKPQDRLTVRLARGRVEATVTETFGE